MGIEAVLKQGRLDRNMNHNLRLENPGKRWNAAKNHRRGRPFPGPARRGAIDSVADLTGLDLSTFAEGQSYGRSGYVERGFTAPKERYRDIVVETGFDREERILDVGCGFGRWSVFLAEVNRSLTGIDPMSGRLAIARNLAARFEFDNTVFTGGVSHDMPFPAASFDGVWCFSALHFVNRSRTLAEIRRVLAPGGRLFVGMYFAVGRMIALLCKAFLTGGWEHRDFKFATIALQGGPLASGPPNYGTVTDIPVIARAHGFEIERTFNIDNGHGSILTAQEAEMLSDPAALVGRFRAEPDFRDRLLADYQRLTRALDYNISFLAHRI